MIIIIIIIASNLPSSPFSPLPRDSNFSKFKRVRGEIETDPQEFLQFLAIRLERRVE